MPRFSDFRYHPITTRSKKIAFNELVEHIHRCSRCNVSTRFEIVLDNRHTYIEFKCPSCSHVMLMETFDFCYKYMLAHFPDHELTKEAQQMKDKYNVINTLPIMKFVENYVEFNKTLE